MGVGSSRVGEKSKAADLQVRQPPVVPDLLQFGEPTARKIENHHGRDPHKVDEGQVIAIPRGRIAKYRSVK